MAKSQVGEERSSATGALQQRASRVRRPDPPNKSAFFEQIAGLESQIDSLQGRIVEIKTLLDNRLHNRRLASPDILAAKNRLSELTDLFRKALDTKKIHREELDVIKERLRGLPSVRADQVDDEIQKLEYKQTHTTLHIDAEKKLLQQVAKLKKSKEALISQEAQTENDLKARNRIIDCIKEDDERLDRLKAQQEEQRRVLAEIHERGASAAIDIPALLQEKSSSYDKIKALRSEIKQLKADFSLKEDEYRKKEREWKAQDAEDRKVRMEKIKAERLERDNIRKQRALENFVEPYTDEIILCDQLISYMQKIAPAQESLSQPQQKNEALVSAGYGDVLISKKDRNDNDLEGWFAGSGGVKNKKSKSSATQRSKLREKISLSIDALTSFEKVKVPAPTTYSDVMKKIEELQKQKEKYIEMQKQARETRERGQNGTDADPEKQDAVDRNEGNQLDPGICNNDDKKVEHATEIIENDGQTNTSPEISNDVQEFPTLLSGGQKDPCEASENDTEASLSESEVDQGQSREPTSEDLTGSKATATATEADCGSVDFATVSFSNDSDATISTEKETDAERGGSEDLEVTELTPESSTSNLL